MCQRHPVSSLLVGVYLTLVYFRTKKKPGLTLACEIIFCLKALSWYKADHFTGSDQTRSAGGISFYTDIIQTKLTV